MICPSCETAGDMNKSFEEIESKITDDMKFQFIQEMVQHHQLCQGCFCQHRVGKWVIIDG